MVFIIRPGGFILDNRTIASHRLIYKGFNWCIELGTYKRNSNEKYHLDRHVLVTNQEIFTGKFPRKIHHKLAPCCFISLSADVYFFATSYFLWARDSPAPPLHPELAISADSRQHIGSAVRLVKGNGLEWLMLWLAHALSREIVPVISDLWSNRRTTQREYKSQSNKS